MNRIIIQLLAKKRRLSRIQGIFSGSFIVIFAFHCIIFSSSDPDAAWNRFLLKPKGRRCDTQRSWGWRSLPPEIPATKTHPDSVPAGSYATFTVKRLKAELRIRKLMVSGLKDDRRKGRNGIIFMMDNPSLPLPEKNSLLLSLPSTPAKRSHRDTQSSKYRL